MAQFLKGINKRLLLFTLTVSCFDGGVELFDDDGSPIYREDTADDGGEADLTEWLDDKSIILLTHTPQFSGCESDAVILVTQNWNVNTRGQARRSGITRGVASMALLISDSLTEIKPK